MGIGHNVQMAIAFRSSNPALNDNALERLTAGEPGWAAGTQVLEDAYAAPSAGQVTHADTMTVKVYGLTASGAMESTPKFEIVYKRQK